MLYKHHQAFCPEGQLISKLAEPLTDLRMSRAKQLCRFTFEVQCRPETNEQQTVLSTASRASVVFFKVIRRMQGRRSNWMKDVRTRSETLRIKKKINVLLDRYIFHYTVFCFSLFSLSRSFSHLVKVCMYLKLQEMQNLSSIANRLWYL